MKSQVYSIKNKDYILRLSNNIIYFLLIFPMFFFPLLIQKCYNKLTYGKRNRR